MTHGFFSCADSGTMQQLWTDLRAGRDAVRHFLSWCNASGGLSMSNRLAAAQIAGSIARRTNEGIEAASWHLARQFDRVIPMRQMLWFAKARIETLPATLKRLRR